MCRGPLATVASALRCVPCSLRYRRNGDVHLLRPPFSADGAAHALWGDRMRTLLADADRLGWEDAFRRFRREVLSGQLRPTASSRWARVCAKMSGATWEDLLQELVDPTRAGWKFFLDLRPQSRVLFLGPTWGAAPLALAGSCAHLTVLDGNAVRLRLVAHQAAAAGITSLSLACVRDPLRLPLPPGAADVAVVPSLSDWLRATGSRSAAAGNLIRLLAELHRVLAPGGHVYCGNANRALPWRLFDAGLGATAQSPAELRATAVRAGFRGCRLLVPFPFRHKFHQVLDLERLDTTSFSPDAYRVRGRVLRTLVRTWDACQRNGLVGRRLFHRLPAVGAVLSVGHTRPSFAERLLEHLVASARIPRGGRLRRYHVRSKGVVVLETAPPGERGVIVRLPLDERAAAACRRHQAALATLAADGRLSSALRRLFPAPLAEGTFESQEYFAESELDGESGRRYYGRSRRRYDRAVVDAAAVVATCRRATEDAVRLDEPEFDRLCGRWLDDLAGLVEDAELRQTLEAIGTFLRRTLVGAVVPLGWQHGDLDFANVLYGAQDRVSAILDFELFDARGLPLLDLIFLLARRPIRRGRVTFGTLFTGSALPRALPPLERTLLAREMAVLGADDTLYRALALCCWLNHLRLRRDSWLVRSPSWLAANLHGVVAHVRRTL